MIRSAILKHMGYIRMATAFLARMFLSAMFLATSINKIIYWKETEKQFLRVLGDWQTYTVASNTWQALLSTLVIWSPMILMTITFIEILGALLLLFGIKEKLGAVLLVIFLIPMTILMQHFWFVEGSERETQILLFLHNLAILGGLLIVILHGGHGKSSGERGDHSLGHLE